MCANARYKINVKSKDRAVLGEITTLCKSPTSFMFHVEVISLPRLSTIILEKSINVAMEPENLFMIATV